MINVDITVKQKSKLDTRIAAEIINKASKYKSNVLVKKDGKKANAKSLLGVLSLGLMAGGSLTTYAEGEDESIAIRSIEEIFAV